MLFRVMLCSLLALEAMSVLIRDVGRSRDRPRPAACLRAINRLRESCGASILCLDVGTTCNEVLLEASSSLVLLV